VARFVRGLRTVAEPLAGSGGLPPFRFFAANLLGAICYVPWPVLAGYGVGYGLGDWIERLRRAAGLEEDVALFAAILAVAAPALLIGSLSSVSPAAHAALAASYLTPALFRQMLGRIERLAWHPT
jgi:membrane protein DedA with SNARE-associated domain